MTRCFKGGRTEAEATELAELFGYCSSCFVGDGGEAGSGGSEAATVVATESMEEWFEDERVGLGLTSCFCGGLL